MRDDRSSKKSVIRSTHTRGAGPRYRRTRRQTRPSHSHARLRRHQRKHSGFFDTTLDTLLDALRIRRVILTGIAGNICVLFTANDAYMRDFKLFAPADCIVSNTGADNDHALHQIETVLKGNVDTPHVSQGATGRKSRSEMTAKGGRNCASWSVGN